MDARTFADVVGRKPLAKAVDVSLGAVTNAVRRGVFPASWYEESRKLADAHNINCPPDLFGQKNNTAAE